MSLNEKMELDFQTIHQRILDSQPVGKEDKRFYDSYLAAKKGTNAGNAGKRKVVKTGK